MDYHIFVIISTIVFYILMWSFSTTSNKKSQGAGSPLIYSLFVPVILYGYKYMTSDGSLVKGSDTLVGKGGSGTGLSLGKNITEIMSDPYPLSSSTGSV
jgi:hypothetical protein